MDFYKLTDEQREVLTRFFENAAMQAAAEDSRRAHSMRIKAGIARQKAAGTGRYSKKGE